MICQNYRIECPYALSSDAPVPCVGTQEQCNEHREIETDQDDMSEDDLPDVGD